MTALLGVPPTDLGRCRHGGVTWHLSPAVDDGTMAGLTEAMLAGARSPAPGLGGRNSVLICPLGSAGMVVVKEYERGGHLRRLVRRAHIRRGATRPEREFRNLREVRSLGVRAPEPLGFASFGRVIYRGWLVTRFVENRGSLAWLARAGERGLDEVVAATAEQVALLIAHDIAHVDLHPGNVIADCQNRPWLLDFDRAYGFNRPAALLRRHYVGRWTRAVQKHALDRAIADVFAAELHRLTQRLSGSRRDIAAVGG